MSASMDAVQAREPLRAERSHGNSRTGTPVGGMVVERLVWLLAILGVSGALVGLLTDGGAGRHVTDTVRGAPVTLYGEGLYAFDTWLVGAGNRGQDAAILLIEVPVLLLVLRWSRKKGPAAEVVM